MATETAEIDKPGYMCRLYDEHTVHVPLLNCRVRASIFDKLKRPVTHHNLILVR